MYNEYELKSSERFQNSNVVFEMLKKVRMEDNSFLDPILSEMSRTTKAVLRYGFTSVSRIAKG